MIVQPKYRDKFTTRSGEIVVIDLDDVNYFVDILAKPDGGPVKRVGRFTFDHIEMHPPSPDYLFITGMDIDEKYKRQGIGEECLKRALDVFVYEIHAASEHGPPLENGGQLINDGPGFIRRMRQKGLIAPD